jgi:D-alanyl-D-alanine-carboxypeptidase/D-alanyl-D-alanine-endopeptidase
MKAMLLFSATGLIVIQATLAQSSAPLIAPGSDVRALLVEHVDERKQSVGIVVGVIEPTGKRVVSYGRPAKNDNRPLDGDSVFQIGSVTKVFTSLLLSDMVQHREVKLDDPVSMYLPKGITMPMHGGSRITLRHLATHTSGLPRDPSNPSSPDPDNPYLGYSIEQFYQFLSSYKLTRKAGSQYEYSNLGGGLLGQVLAKHAGVDYATLVKTRICDPLGMNSTRAHITANLNKRLVTGHSERLDPVPMLDLAVIPGASVLRSTANDLLIFLAAVLGYEKTPLVPAMSAMLDHPQSTGAPGLEIALGWHISTINGTRFVWHNGGLGGCGSFIGYDPKSRMGVVVLSNSETPAIADQIGFHLLDQQAQRRGADEKTETEKESEQR